MISTRYFSRYSTRLTKHQVQSKHPHINPTLCNSGLPLKNNEKKRKEHTKELSTIYTITIVTSTNSNEFDK